MTEFPRPRPTLFQNRLVDEMRKYSPATNGTALELTGLAEIHNYIGRKRLHEALLGYKEVVM